MALRPTLRAALALLAAASLLAAPAGAQEDMRRREYRIKAAFLYNFTRFVAWPPESFGRTPSHVVVAVVGEDPFGPLLDEYEGKPVGPRTVAVRRFASADEIGPCHVLFVSASERGRLGRILRKAREEGILTVGNGRDYARQGLAVTFVPAGERVAFEIDARAAEEGGLRLSSRLLSLGRSAGGNGGGRP